MKKSTVLGLATSCIGAVLAVTLMFHPVSFVEQGETVYEQVTTSSIETTSEVTTIDTTTTGNLATETTYETTISNSPYEEEKNFSTMEAESEGILDEITVETQPPVIETQPVEVEVTTSVIEPVIEQITTSKVTTAPKTVLSETSSSKETEKSLSYEEYVRENVTQVTDKPVTQGTTLYDETAYETYPPYFGYREPFNYNYSDSYETDYSYVTSNSETQFTYTEPAQLVGNQVSIIGPEGNTLYFDYVEGATTPFEALKLLCAKYNISYTSEGFGSMVYISEIAGYKEMDYSDTSGWCYSVNGTTPNVGAGIYSLKENDIVSWYYVKELTW